MMTTRHDPIEKLWIFFFTIITITQVACTKDIVNPVPSTVVIRDTPTPTATALVSSQTRQPTASVSPTLVYPSATPLPDLIKVWADELWHEQLVNALGYLANGDNMFRWEIATNRSTADYVIESATEGLIVDRRPLALTVDFTTSWEAVSLKEAQTILAEGHPLVEIVNWNSTRPMKKALRVDGLAPDDPRYPIAQLWHLEKQIDNTEAETKLLEAIGETRADTSFVRLSAVGDISLDRRLGQAITDGNIEYPFALVADQLRSAHVTVGNLESALGDLGQPVQKSYTFRAPEQAVSSFQWAGFDVLTLANNHAMDFGPVALQNALELFNLSGIGVVGAGIDRRAAHSPYVMVVGDLTLAFLGYVHVPVEGSGFDTFRWQAGIDSPGIAWADPTVIGDDVSRALTMADLVIVNLHSGYEYRAEPSPPQIAASQAAIDAGASLVIGHHSHLLQGIQFYRDGVIVYGLGNFAFDITGNPESAILYVWFDRDGVRQIEILPVIIQSGGQPRIALEAEAKTIRDKIYLLTKLVN